MRFFIEFWDAKSIIPIKCEFGATKWPHTFRSFWGYLELKVQIIFYRWFNARGGVEAKVFIYKASLDVQPPLFWPIFSESGIVFLNDHLIKRKFLLINIEFVEVNRNKQDKKN